MTAPLSAHLRDQELDDFVDGALAPDARQRVEAHVAGCRECDRALREARDLRSWTAEQRAAVQAPPELWPLVAASTIHLPAVRRQVLRSMRGVLLLAALTLVAGTALVTWRAARWRMADDPPPRAGASGRGGTHAGHPTTRRPQDGPPAPPAPPKPPRPTPAEGPQPRM